jgi:micrococcal nuclease
MTTRRALSALVALLTALVAALAVTRGQTAGAGGSDVIRIVRVVDGDTVVAHLPGGDEKVRLIGIDTPETVDPRKPVQCFGKEASDRTKQLLPPGTAVRLERDVEARDRYGRLLAYVYRSSDGTFVNLALAEEGFAQPLTIPPNVAYTSRFSAAAAAARAAHRGLWSACPT